MTTQSFTPICRFRKKPVVIDAFCLGIDNMPDWFCDQRTAGKIRTFGEWKHLTHCEIDTLEGTMRGERGDYIIKGVKGEIYPCKPDIFAATYERADLSERGEISANAETVKMDWPRVPIGGAHETHPSNRAFVQSSDKKLCTPRTDALLAKMQLATERTEGERNLLELATEHSSAWCEHARQLERELAAVCAANDRLTVSSSTVALDRGWNPLATELRRIADAYPETAHVAKLLWEVASNVELREAEVSSAYESVGLLMKALGHGGGHGAMTIEVIERMQKAEAAVSATLLPEPTLELMEAMVRPLEVDYPMHAGMMLDVAHIVYANLREALKLGYLPSLYKDGNPKRSSYVGEKT